MSKTSEQKCMEILKSTEEVADQVLVNKQELINLDRRRQQNREAIRELEKNPEQQEKKVWTTIGSMLVKLDRQKALELLKKDQTQIEREIKILQSDQKILVNKHRDLEHFSPYSGTNIKPLDRKEFSALKANLPML
ncbi:p53 and DNA damage-regulated protein 1 [Lucilia sericata]|uniref:p53 and DNA damage-regulated protein 1 n=1 Tax=Lucilia sericata TaxID=13632 RepID=UPI0018A87C41|nr:p53 and DNA damage-regulated protein 1 [Lucilia sericata]XP_037823777.1 p53 and DNA damage-regulated protein 1 [Lucilia sericata]